EIRLRSAAGETGAGISGEAELIRQPRQCMPFDLVRRWRGAPGCQLWVVHRNQRVRDDGCKRHTRVEKAEVARMSYLHLPHSQHPFDIRGDVVQLQWLGEVIARG